MPLPPPVTIAVWPASVMAVAPSRAATGQGAEGDPSWSSRGAAAVAGAGAPRMAPTIADPAPASQRPEACIVRWQRVGPLPCTVVGREVRRGQEGTARGEQDGFAQAGRPTRPARAEAEALHGLAEPDARAAEVGGQRLARLVDRRGTSRGEVLAAN